METINIKEAMQSFDTVHDKLRQQVFDRLQKDRSDLLEELKRLRDHIDSMAFYDKSFWKAAKLDSTDSLINRIEEKEDGNTER